jgi:lipopolysaccharide biosynthesis regulator YciM
MTREEIEKDPWFGNQREAVLKLLDRAEKAEQQLKEINEWCEPVGTGKGGDALNLVSSLYQRTKEWR